MLTLIAVLAGLSVLAAAYHPLVPIILQSEQHGLLSDGVMLITLKQRDSSEMKTFPVDYLREGNMVYIGSDSGWWKHLEGGAEVSLLIQGTEVTGWATPIHRRSRAQQRGVQETASVDVQTGGMDRRGFCRGHNPGR